MLYMYTHTQEQRAVPGGDHTTTYTTRAKIAHQPPLSTISRSRVTGSVGGGQLQGEQEDGGEFILD